MVPGVLLFAVLLAICVFGFAATQHMAWFAPIPVGVVVLLVWLVTLLRAHPTEWRFGGQR